MPFRSPIVGISCSIFAAATALAQQTAVQTTQIRKPTMTVSPAQGMMAVVTGAPYSALEVSEQVQTLSDGTHITRKMGTVQTYRDSLGRTRTERQMPGPVFSEGRNAPTLIQIRDPVAGYMYTLDPDNHIAHRSALAARLPPQPAGQQTVVTQAVGIAGGMGGGAMVSGGVVGSRATPSIASEPLGTQVIEGVTVTGTRRTMTWPIDSQGNDRPIVATTESWFSPQLRTTVRTKQSDPRTGEHTTELRDISLAEPDPTLFQAPAGYQIVDETGPFKVGGQQ
jgi:hypothetical protein